MPLPSALVAPVVTPAIAPALIASSKSSPCARREPVVAMPTDAAVPGPANESPGIPNAYAAADTINVIGSSLIG